MNQLNQIILEGNIVNDVEVTEPREGFKVFVVVEHIDFLKKSAGKEENL